MFEHFTDYRLLRVRSREWNAAWRALMAATGDADAMAEDPHTLEVWQYMGTCRLLGRWVHEFRHRHHPRLQRRWLLRVPVSPGWKFEDEKRRVLH